MRDVTDAMLRWQVGCPR